MKRIFLTGLLFLAAAVAFSQKSKKTSIEAKAFNIGAFYLNPSRAQFDKYINTISTTLGLANTIKPATNVGGSFAFSIRNNKNEFEVGGALAIGLRQKSSNAANTVTASLSTKTIDIHFGYCNYVGGPLFIGFDLGAVNNDGKLEQVGAPSNLFEATPGSSNPFKGYIFSVKPKAGLFFPFKSKGYSGFKLTAFYDLGISKYQFYTNDIFDIRLKNYTGETKSSYNAFGAQAAIVVGLD
ncbi:hypothetical protein [Ferruginibacter sp. SUN106]|uniref:hypothetical protein n=1 Tax=Ferruginibacter sp. SUN106 TaxID=2978348 RepID=UPI003D362BF0